MIIGFDVRNNKLHIINRRVRIMNAEVFHDFFRKTFPGEELLMRKGCGRVCIKPRDEEDSKRFSDAYAAFMSEKSDMDEFDFLDKVHADRGIILK
jgi:hypothetical protein